MAAQIALEMHERLVLFEAEEAVAEAVEAVAGGEDGVENEELELELELESVGGGEEDGAIRRED